ncbi:LysR substrate-binding domain-containing protein [Phenylobacterium sp.]|uniref:LysR substrate-binding domain-containing protein n=1 Tax=Phenylobacterium sp. TaxID=1871053 RepID=UPI00301C3989
MSSNPTSTSPRQQRAVEAPRAPTHLTSALLLSLQAFDWAVRLGSFRAAATALHLTPSAVSHRIRNLERVIGDRLFTRANRMVRPTRAGVALAAITAGAFTELARATAHKDLSPSHTRLKLAVMPAFASAWLLPRLGGFVTANPSVEISIENVSRGIDFETELFDAAICPGDGDWPGLSATHLMDIFTTPVCTAEMAQRLKLGAPEDLERATLIQVTTYPLAWPLWFSEAGVGEIKPRQTLWVDSYTTALQAAEQGIGVAMGLEPLVSERRDGEPLRQPIPIRHPNGSYWLVHRPNDQGRAGLRAFRRWIMSEFAED